LIVNGNGRYANVWYGIIGDKLIGSYFINGTLNSIIKYDNFIRNDLEILLEDVQLNIRRVMWYQHARWMSRTFWT